MEKAAQRLIIALDDIEHEKIEKLIETTRPFATTYKIGLSLFVAHGPAIVRKIGGLGADIFLDLKLHDIPMQVGLAVLHALEFSPRFLTIHAQGGRAMMKEVASAVRGSKTKVLAVTVLTSLNQRDFYDLGYHDRIEDGVLKLADLALSAGIDGLVTSPRELSWLRAQFGEGPYLVCPGVRARDDATHDQARVMTAHEAIDAGANALVIGRPITQATNVLLKAEAMHQEISRAMKERADSKESCHEI